MNSRNTRLRSIDFKSLTPVLTAFLAAIALAAPLLAHAQTGAQPSFLKLALSKSLGMTAKDSDFAYRVNVDSDQAEVSIYQLASPGTYEVQSYHCHTELDATGTLEGAHCHDEGISSPVLHTLPAKPIDRSGFLAAIDSAVSIFERRIAKIETLLELKIWQHGDDMTLRITSGDPTTPAVNLFNCHLHSGTYDCHRTRKAGPNEPAN